jgi:hypothetical protein
MTADRLARILAHVARILLERLELEEPPDNSHADLPPLERAILATASQVPLTSRKLARLAGYSYNSRFRQTLTDMVRSGLLVRFARKYSLPKPAKP